jgi:transcriptional regulator with XRE-family HTH domain
MATNSLIAGGGTLGGFLRERRARIAPAGGADRRRRTPGLRREEVATRAGVSVTWYTWLEQGRGGAPSADVLERLSEALELDPDGRELMFLLAQHRPPPLQPAALADVPPSLQRVLDSMPSSPAIVKTPSWDVVAWNQAALVVLGRYDNYAPGTFNVLRKMVMDTERREALPDWEDNIRFALAVFRIDVARAGGSARADALVAELQEKSADFRRLWGEPAARTHGVNTKRMHHPELGLMQLETTGFSVSGAEGLTMIVFNPATDADRDKVATLLARRRLDA